MCLWVPFQGDWLALMGVFTILAGTVLVIVGSSALFLAWLAASREEDWDRGLVRRKVLGCAALLFVNFPVAAGCVWIAEVMGDSGSSGTWILIVGPEGTVASHAETNG